MTRRWPLALRAGAAAYAVATVVWALALAPFVSTQLEFGHQHSPGTTAHVHTLSSFLSSAPAAPAVSLPCMLFSLVFLPLLTTDPLPTRWGGLRQSRAPPERLLHL